MAEQEMEQLPASVIKSLPDAGLLRAEIMICEKNWDNRGNALIERVEEEMLAVPGPDAWSEVLFQLERIAKVARQVGDWELAGSTARKMIQHDSSYAGGYFALGLVAEHQGDAPTARQEFTELMGSGKTRVAKSASLTAGTYRLRVTNRSNWVCTIQVR